MANTSRGTVDKVLHNRFGVSPKTRERVLEIVKELNYEQNIIAKTLVRKEPISIDIILTPQDNPYITEILLGVNKAMEEYAPFNVEVAVEMLPSLKAAEQVNILEAQYRKGTKGIVLFPIDDAEVIQKANQIVAADIPVITFNSRIDQIKGLWYIGQNHVQGGRTAAGLLCKVVRPVKKLGVIISSYSLSCHRERLQGFTQKVKDVMPDAVIVDTIENEDGDEAAFEATIQMCNRYPDMDSIYITGGGVGGLGKALKLLDRKDIHVICHDLTADARALLAEGYVDFVLGQNPQYQGYLMVKTLFDYILKKVSPQANALEMPIDIYTEDNL